MKPRNIITVLVIGLLVILGLLGKVAYTNYQLTSSNEQLNTKLMEADLNTGRAKTSFGDAQAEIVHLNSTIASEIKARGAEITRYGELQARYDVLVAKKPVVNTKIVYRDKDPIVCEGLSVEKGMVYQANSEKSLLPLQEHTGRSKDFRIDIDCTVFPEPNSEQKIPMEMGYQLHQKFGGQLVETRLPSGGINHYVNLYEIGPEGQRLDDLKLDSWAVIVTDELAPQWYWWAPHVDILGFVGGGPENLPYVGGSLGVSFMGYGRTENDLSWRVLRISGDFGTDLGLGFTPVLYNLGELIPLISNLWIGPHVQKGLVTSWSAGVVLGAQL